MALGLTMLRRLDEFTSARRANAAALLAELRAIGLDTVEPHAGTAPAYLRLPVLLAGEREQSAAIAALNSAGIGATGSYPASIADVPELRNDLADPRPVATGGREIARRIVTLPTHPLVAASDIRRMRIILQGGAFRTAHAKATA